VGKRLKTKNRNKKKMRVLIAFKIGGLAIRFWTLKKFN